MKVEYPCPLCGKILKIAFVDGKISEKDRKARLKQHIELSNLHRDSRIPPRGSSEKLKRVLKDLGL